MNTTPHNKLLVALQRLHGESPRKTEGGWVARCPAHDDKKPSLSISIGDDGRTLVHCHAGCTVENVVAALALTMADIMGTVTVTKTLAGFNATRGLGDGDASRTREIFPTAQAAVAAHERHNGRREACFVYRDAEDRPIGVVVRWRTSNGKVIRPFLKTPDGWQLGAMSYPRPLFNLSNLPSAHRIYITEGEQAASAAIGLGLIATTSAGGAKAARKTDWSTLAGKEAILLPDNDDAGESYMDDVSAILSALIPPAVLKMVILPGLPVAGDIVEFIAARTSAGFEAAAIRSEIEAMADAAQPVECKPLEPAVPAPMPFPLDSLPAKTRAFVATCTASMGCPPDYFAVPMLSVFSGAIGNSRLLQLKPGFAVPAIIWTATVGESGTMKSPAFQVVTKPVWEVQKQAFTEHKLKVDEHQKKIAEYDAQDREWKKKPAGDPPTKPAEPQPDRVVVVDTTIEALAPILAENPRGVLLAPEELDGWLGSFDRYSGGRGADQPRWLQVFDGGDLIVDRKTGPTRVIHVPRASVSITGTIQPGILKRALGHREREGGMSSRLLFSMPLRQQKRWTEAGIPPEVQAEYALIVHRLRELQPELLASGPEPKLCRLTPEAKSLWVNYYNDHAAEMSILTGDLAAAWAKLEGYAARLALIIHFVRWAEMDSTLANPEYVDAVSMAAGIGLAQWFGNEAKRVYAILSEGADEQERRELLEWIDRHGGVVTVRDLTHGIRRFRSNPELATKALEKLGELGFGQWASPAPGPCGGRPRREFRRSNRTVASCSENPPIIPPEFSTAIGPAVNDGWGEI